MADNNPAGDNIWTNTPKMSIIEFDSMLFEDVDVGDLIWLANIPSDKNNPCRKLSETAVMNTRTRDIVSVQPRTVVYQKI